MTLSVNNSMITENADESVVSEFLDGTDTGYVIPEDEISGSYIQTMISPGGVSGIAEARIYSGRDFRHYRAETDSSSSGKTVVCGITVMKKQVIGISSIKGMFLYFLENTNIDPQYIWGEMPKDHFDWIVGSPYQLKRRMAVPCGVYIYVCNIAFISAKSPEHFGIYAVDIAGAI